MDLDAALGQLARDPDASFDVAELALRLATDEYPDLDVEADRKRTRLNSSHITISSAVFCLKKKKHRKQQHTDNNVNPHEISTSYNDKQNSTTSNTTNNNTEQRQC